MRRFSFLFIMTGLLFSPSIHADQVDTYIKLRMDKEHLPGLSLAVLRDGKIIKLKGYGYANLELKVPASPGTVYQVGSITKQFTATAILILVQENIVGLDDKIGKYLNGTPEAWKEITVRNLLTHTSGLQGEGANRPCKSALCGRRGDPPVCQFLINDLSAFGSWSVLFFLKYSDERRGANVRRRSRNAPFNVS
jgi:CubicO group peptidase (beta-lactamase class C family)